MLETGAGEEALREYLDDWWVHMDGASAETRQEWRIARQEFVRLMDTLVATLTDRQRATFQKRLGDLRSELAPFITQRQQAANLPLASSCASATA
jgi:hypothetical protein